MKKYLFLISLFPIAVQAAAVKYAVNADVYSEPLPIHAFLDDWQDPNFKSGENAFAHGKMKLSAQQGPWNTGWVWSYDYALNFSPDMAKLYYQIENDLPIDANSSYDLFLEAQHVDTIGARLAYDWALNPDWTVTAGVTALIGRHYVDGQFNAYSQTTDQINLMDRVSWLNGQLDYSYDAPALKEDELGLGDLRVKQGYGYALDFTVNGQINEQWKVNLQLEDIFSYLYWDQAPYSRYEIHYDQDKRPRMDLSGRVDTRQQYRQEIPYKIRSEIEYRPIQPLSFTLSSFSNPYLTLFQLNSYWENDFVKLGVHAEPQTQAFGVSLQHQNVGFKYIADALNTNQAKRMGASLYAQYAW